MPVNSNSIKDMPGYVRHFGNFITVDNAIQEEFLFLEAIKSHCMDAVDEKIVDLRCQWLTMAETGGRLHISRKKAYDEWERFIMRLRTQKMTVQQMAKELNLPVAILHPDIFRFCLTDAEIKTIKLFQELRNAAAVARQLEKGETTVRHRLETIDQSL